MNKKLIRIFPPFFIISPFDQVFFISASYATLYLIYVKFKATYDRNHDTFRVEFLLGPAALLALVLNNEFSFLEVRLDADFWKTTQPTSFLVV